jgi:hypothetical protein
MFVDELQVKSYLPPIEDRVEAKAIFCLSGLPRGLLE